MVPYEYFASVTQSGIITTLILPWASVVTLSACLQVLANLVMEELLPSLQTELLPKLKGKKPERKRVWFAVSEISLLLTAILRTLTRYVVNVTVRKHFGWSILNI